MIKVILNMINKNRMQLKLFKNLFPIKIKLKKPGSVKRRSVLIDPNSPYLEPLESCS